MNSKDPNFSGMRLAAPGGSVFGKLLAIAAGTLLLVVGFMFSLLAFAVVVVAGVIFFAWLKWQTRHLRRHLEAQPREQGQQPTGRHEQTAPGQVIEGEVIGGAEYDERPSTPSQTTNDPPTNRDQQRGP